MKIRALQLSDAKRKEILDALYTAACSLNGKEAIKNFLHDLLTESEQIMLGRRILIARALLSGMTHDEIVEEYKVGKDTIQRIVRWLDDQIPGHEKATAERKEESSERAKDNIKKRLFATSALYRLKKKYPMHFLLFPSLIDKK